MKPDRGLLVQAALSVVISFALALFLRDTAGKLFHVLSLGLGAIILPFLIALVLSYVLRPAVTALEVKGVSQLQAIVLINVTMIIVGGALMILLYPAVTNELNAWQRDLPVYVRTLSGFLDGLERDNAALTRLGLNKELRVFWEHNRPDFFLLAVDLIRVGVSLLIFVPLFTLFLLIDGSRIQRTLIQAVPNRYFESGLIIFYEVHQSLGRFIRGRLFQVVVLFLISWLGFYFVGLPHAWFFGLAVGLAKLVPFLGTALAGIGTVMFAFLILRDWFLVGLTFSTLAFVELIDFVFLVPAVLKRRYSIHPALGMIAIVIGGQVMGLLGMVIAIPVAVILKIIAAEIARHFRGYEGSRHAGEPARV